MGQAHHLAGRARGRGRMALVVCLALLFPSLHAEARQTRIAALYAEARAHEHGEGVARDAGRAERLYCQAAALGDAESAFALGWMYANGRGVVRDDALARAMFERAAGQGHDYAQRMLRFTSGPGREPECLRAAWWANGNPATLHGRVGRLSAERREIARLVTGLAPQYSIHPDLALAIALTESALDPRARSPKNAMGVMQLIPATAARFNVRDAYDPEQNIKGGLAYLRWLLAYFEGDVVLAAAAYNAGEGAVERYRGVPPFRETRDYVKRVLGLIEQRHHPFDASVVQASAVVGAMRVASEGGAR